MTPKNLNRLLTLVNVLFFAHGVFAQTGASKTTPQAVLVAFNARYPQAQIKLWKKEKAIYVAKFDLGNHKYAAAFDAEGKWIETNLKIAWPWHLPDEVKNTFKKSRHGNWNTYRVTQIENPSGRFYEIAVDNTNQQVSISHQIVLDKYWLVDIKPDGELIDEKIDAIAPGDNLL